MNWNHPARKVLVAGMSGSGKTTKALDLLRGWRARNVFVFDPDTEFSRKMGWQVAVAVNQLNHAATHGIPVCFYPGEMFSDFTEGFDFFCRWVFNVSSVITGKKVLVVDELQRWTSARSGLPASFTEVLDKGRREEIDLLLIAQSPNRVNHVVRLQLTEVFTFRLIDRLPLEAVEEFGFNSERVKSLRYPGGFIHRNLITGQTNEHKRAAT